jgi:hypothetical protein
VFADSKVSGICTFCPAVPHLLRKPGVVLLEEFQKVSCFTPIPR